MHRCLLIPEIVLHICDNIGDQDLKLYLDLERNRSLFAMAQTCKTFRDPALTMLWEFIPDISPIIKCVGRDFWEAHEKQHERLKLQLTRRISLSDAATMKKYAHIVHRFGENRSSNPWLSFREIWKKLGRTFKNETLFTNVHVVYVNDKHIIDSINLFAVQNFTHLTLPTPIPTPAEFSALCPDLKRVSFSRESTTSDIVAALSKWRNLSHVDTTGASPEILEALSHHCSSLRNLTLIRHTLLQPTKAYSLTFPALEKLSIECHGTASLAIQLINFLPSIINLRSLTITFNVRDVERNREREWMELLDAVKKYSQLVELVINEFQRLGSVVLLSAAPMHLLIAEFTMLRRIKIWHSGAFDIANEDLKMMAQALPLLEEFHLINPSAGYEEEFWRYTPDTKPVGFKTTIASLEYFAESCPLLSSLTLEFDARKVPVGKWKIFTRPRSLTRIDVSFSPVDEDQGLVARYLFHLFPKVRYLLCERQAILPAERAKSNSPWLGVWHHIKVYQGWM